MAAGGTGGVGGRREKTTALADECDSRCGARAATLTDEELEGGTGGTGSLSAHTGGPITSSHSRAGLCTRFAICLAPKSTPRRSRNSPAGGFWVRQLLAAHRESHGQSACITESRRSKGGSLWIGTCRHHRSDRAEAFRVAVMLEGGGRRMCSNAGKPPAAGVTKVGVNAHQRIF